MEYKTLNGTDSQELELKEGDLLEIQLLYRRRRLFESRGSKGEEEPIFEEENISVNRVTLEIEESGTYTVTVTGQKARGSVSFVKTEKEG